MSNPFQKLFIHKDHIDNDMFHLMIVPNVRANPAHRYHVAAIHRDHLFDILSEGDVIDTANGLENGEEVEITIDIREA